MDFKLKSLYDKVYSNFIKGIYGEPRIPNKNEVLKKIYEVTTEDPTPIIQNTKMLDIDIATISSQFERAIDDIDVLFKAVESESSTILDQLTNSLKEHNGVKRELRQINQQADDISNGKLGEEYLQYTFTESFNNLNNIDALRSDPVDLKAGQFTIKQNSSNVLSLDHYRGKKLEFSIVENFARILDYGYVGTTDAETILDPDDPRDLTYRIQTNNFTSLRVATSIQLGPSAEFLDINGVSLDIDSRSNKGQVRLYYRGKDAQWKDVKPVSILDIKGDKVQFVFNTVSTSHIKIEFIKAAPDISDTKEYFISIRSVSIMSADSVITSTLISKPIILQHYSNETPILEKIKAHADLIIPPGTNLNVYVAKDILISGKFKDCNGNPVTADSPNIYNFDPSITGYVYLSDILNATSTVSGTAMYKNQDYDWKPIDLYSSSGDTIPKIVRFGNTESVPTIINSIYQNGVPKYLYRDPSYSGTYPPSNSELWYLSGWCNINNTNWSTLEPYVESGILVSGVDVAQLVWGPGYDVLNIQDSEGNIHPDIINSNLYSGQWLGYGSGVGYPFGYFNSEDNRVIQFGENTRTIDGWYRPGADAITYSGFKQGYVDQDGILLDIYKNIIPEFYFNGINFWSIYKFGDDSLAVVPSIKIYTYQERPIFGDDRYYPHSFVWKYKSSWEIKTDNKLNISPVAIDGGDTEKFSGYKLNISTFTNINNEDLIFNAISEIRVHNTNIVLSQDDYILYPTSSTPTEIRLAPLDNRPNLIPEGISFDIKYSYKSRNLYESTWTGFAIVSTNVTDPKIIIPNIKIHDKKGIPVIKQIDVEDLDDGSIYNIQSTDDVFNIQFKITSSDKENKHYKITIYCAGDESTGFCAKYNYDGHWIPFQSLSRKTITVSQGIKLVSNLSPLIITDLGSLIYDSTIYNSRKAAIYESFDGKKTIIVRQPNKDNFPGYYFDSVNKRYNRFPNSAIDNRGHWIRTSYIDSSGTIITYTTGSSGISPGKVYITNQQAVDDAVDTTWNDGSCLIQYPNGMDGVFFPAHSTFGHPININDVETQYVTLTLYDGDIDPRAKTVDKGYVGSNQHTVWLQANYPNDYSIYVYNRSRNGRGYYTFSSTVENKGFLFYNTAENIPAYYSISYKVPNSTEESIDRFLYKINLSSDNDSNLSPIVRSIKFVINED